MTGVQGRPERACADDPGRPALTRRRFLELLARPWRWIRGRLGFDRSDVEPDWVYDAEAGVWRNPKLSRAIREAAMRDSAFSRFHDRPDGL